jgi:hypothetical protein
MPAGTWNLGRIRKRVDFIGLAQSPTIEFTESTRQAVDNFNVVHLPVRFTSGKNLFKFNPVPNSFVDGSKIWIEISDVNGSPI